MEALLIVDMQNDFMPGGALAIPDGDKVIPVINKLSAKIPFVLASQDWHPRNHISFKERGGPWPPHCVQKSKGADFHPDLDQSKISLIQRKGYLPDREQYSAFDQTGLAEMLKCRGVEHLYITGVATDYCVFWSTLGALEGGLKCTVVLDGVKGVEVQPGDVEKALEKMKQAGAQFATSDEVLAQL